MKKVLIITYYWPPAGGSGVQRWLKFTKYLPKNNWMPIIYTPEDPYFEVKDTDLLDDVPSEVRVLKKSIWEPYTLKSRLFGKSDKSQSVGVISRKRSFKNYMINWIRGNFFIPDPKVYWVNPSVKFLKDKIRLENIKHIVTTGPPHSMHLIGLSLKQAIPNLKWIADFRDPWTDIEYFDRLSFWNDSKKRHIKLEKEVLRKADLVLTVSEYWSGRFKELGAKKVEFLFNGFDEKEYPLKVSQKKKFRIGHFGLYNELRDHNSFWQAINNIIHDNKIFSDNLELFFAGPIHSGFDKNLKELGLHKYLNHHEWLSHKEVLKEMVQTDLLLITHSNTKDVNGRLPAKFFEYLGAKKPILAIGNKQSDLSKLILSLNCGTFLDFDDIKGIETALIKYFNDDNKQNKNIDFSFLSWDSQSEKLIKILNSL